VRIVDSTDVTGLVTEGGRVTGVLTRPDRAPAGATAGAAETVAADLVVDAAGRGSRTPGWLGELGYPVPRGTELRAGVVYVSRLYSARPDQLDGRIGGLVTPYPGEPRAAVVLRQEDDRFIVLLAGMTGVDPPTDDAGMLAFADALACPDVSAVLRACEPLSEPVKFRFTASTWHHYEDLDRYLSGFLVIGDALCSLNPVYGQGITLAALEALELRRLLGDQAARVGSGAGGHPRAGLGVGADLPRRFFRATGKLTALAWETSAAGDLRFPEVEGKRRPGTGIVNAYLARYRAAASVDPVLGTTFLRVANMMDTPTKLLAPGHVLRVLRSAGQGTRTPPRVTAGRRPDVSALLLPHSRAA
jgi:hypothetical protein